MPERRPVVGTSEAMERITNVSRRECHRTVPMKVLALELSGTGTASLRQALLDFGYEDCYHFAALHENPPDCEVRLGFAFSSNGSTRKSMTDTEPQDVGRSAQGQIRRHWS